MSIIGDKYKGYKGAQDWLAEALKAKFTILKTVEVKSKNEAGKEIVTKRQVVDGIDVDAVFSVARENGFDVDKYETQRDVHGFAGRFRMTVGNMLRAKARKDGKIKLSGKWLAAPQEWLDVQPKPKEKPAKVEKATAPRVARKPAKAAA